MLLASDGVRPPRQARSRATFERLLDAAEDLFKSHGVERTSMAAVAAHAGSSIGALYERVPDKTALVRAVQLRVLNRRLSRLEIASSHYRDSDLSLAELLERLVESVVVGIGSDAGLIRAIIVEGVRDEVMRQRFVRVLDGVTQALADLLRHHRAALTHQDPQLAADTIVRVLIGTLQHSILLDRPIDFDRTTAELQGLVLRYLGL